MNQVTHDCINPGVGVHAKQHRRLFPDFELIDGRLRQQFAGSSERTIIPGDEINIEFTSGAITWREEKFAFPALGSVPQSLVIAEGVENLVAKRLGLGH